MTPNISTKHHGQVVLRIQAVPGSNLVPDTCYPEIFSGFPQSLQANAGIVP
jgi:hypothetical protein